MVLDTAVNKGKDRIAQAVAPSREVTRLLENIVGPIQLVLLVLTILIVIVAAISILVSIYNSMSERSHDIAVMRALGASRQSVMTIVLLESILLSLIGGVAGILLGHALARPRQSVRRGPHGRDPRPVRVRPAGNDPDPGPGGPRVDRGFPAGRVGLSHRRGQSPGRQPLGAPAAARHD